MTKIRHMIEKQQQLKNLLNRIKSRTVVKAGHNHNLSLAILEYFV